MLQIQNLSFAYDSKIILKNINLTIQPGEIISLLGESGIGKTTLFQLITGLLSPLEGEIKINGSSPSEAKNSFSYLTQLDLLLPWRTALENLFLFSELSKTKKDKEKAFKALEEVGLKGYEYYYPHQLSGGMKQKLSLARVFFHKRPLLLLDEPFGSLDRASKEALFHYLLFLQQKNHLTILFITHDEQEARRLAKKVFFLDEGILIEK